MEKNINEAELIHAEFNSAFNNADIHLNNLINSLEKNLTSDYSNLINDYSQIKSIFPKSSTIKSLDSINKDQISIDVELKELKKLKVILDNIRLTSTNKIIAYFQVIEILDKYDLYIGNSQHFIDMIPEFNMKQLLNYKKNYADSKYNGSYHSNKPICAQNIFKTLFDCFYICAPKHMFSKSKDRFIVGREIFYDEYLKQTFKYDKPTFSKDPIILKPLAINNSIGDELKLFHVVTAWGPEAKDPLILNPINN